MPGYADRMLLARKAIDHSRKCDIPVIFIQEVHRPDHVDFGRELDKSKVHCIEGSWGAEIIPQIQVTEEDFKVIKRRFSGFFATDLDLLLKGLQVDTVYLCGIAGDGCVRATAVDAHQLNYKVLLIEEAVAGLTRDSCHWALRYLDSLQQEMLVPLAEF